jgi:predicted Zn-dependent peptidase
MEKITTHVFSNGLPSVYISIPSSKIFTAVLIVGVGSRFEEEQYQGLSRFYANICFQGSQDYQDKDSLAQVIDSLGLVIKPSVYPEYSLYYFSSTKPILKPGLDLFLKTIFSPALTSEGLEEEKKLTLAEVEMTSKNPQLFTLNKLSSSLFPQSPLGFDAMGTTEGTNNINLETLQNFKNRFYTAQNSLLVITGPDPDFNLKDLENKTNFIPSGSRQEFTPFDFSQTQTTQDNINQPGSFSYLTYAALCFGRNSEKRITQNIILNILSEGRNNQRLKKLQQDKKTSFLKPWIKIFADCGLFIIQTSCSSNLKQEVHQEILDQLENISQTIAQEELDQAKAYYQNKLLASLSNPLELAFFYGLSFFFNLKEQTPKEVQNQVEKTNLKQVKKVASEIFRPNALSWIIVGPEY